MSDHEKRFEIEKTFGLGVLFKLTKTNVAGIKISENGGKLRSNVGISKLNDAVNRTIESHNIRLKIK